MNSWIAVIGSGVIAYLVKLAGYLVPKRMLDKPLIAKSAALFPIALLSALLGIQTLVTKTSIVVDARVPALAAAFIALRFKAPFILVVVIGAGTAALIRAQGWMA